MRTIWFDFDGTLVDVKARFYSVHKTICSRFSIKPLPETEYWKARCEGISTLEILKGISAENLFEQYIAERNKLIESPEFLGMDKVREGVKETLLNLKSKYQFNILTGRSSREALEWQLNHLSLAGFFYGIFVVSPYGDWQDKYNVLQMNSRPGDIVIGDAPRDMIAGKKAGLKTIAILDGMATKERIEDTHPDVSITFFKEIIANIA